MFITKQQKIALKTMAIKAKVYNFIRTRLYKVEDMDGTSKIEFYKKVFELNKKAHEELREFKRKRKAKAKVEKERVERGYKPKVKTSKLDWEKTLQNGTIPAGDWFIPGSTEEDRRKLVTGEGATEYGKNVAPDGWNYKLHNGVVKIKEEEGATYYDTTLKRYRTFEEGKWKDTPMDKNGLFKGFLPVDEHHQNVINGGLEIVFPRCDNTWATKEQLNPKGFPDENHLEFKNPITGKEPDWK